MSEPKEETASAKISPLMGEDNYSDWSFDIQAYLLGLRLMSTLHETPVLHIPVTVPTGDPNQSPRVLTTDELNTLNAKIQNQHRAYSIVIRYLSPQVKAALSAEAKNLLEPNPKLLWEELNRSYSKATGHRVGELYSILWTTRIPEGADPRPYLATLRSALAQLKQTQSVDDQQCAYAMLHALPASFRPIKQLLWAQTKFSTSDVIAQVSGKWVRAQGDVAEEAGMALLAQSKSTVNSKRRKEKTGDDAGESQYCIWHGPNRHSSKDCWVEQRQKEIKAGKVAEAKLAEADTYEADASSAYLAQTTAPNLSSPSTTFVIDSGATDHMVSDPSLLHDVRHASTEHIRIGDGSLLPSTQRGSITIQGVDFHNVLVVPGLDRNLLSARRTPTGAQWLFTRRAALLLDASGKILLASDFSDKGLYTLQASSPSVYLASTTDALLDWHCRLGHLNVRSVAKLASCGSSLHAMH